MPIAKKAKKRPALAAGDEIDRFIERADESNGGGDKKKRVMIRLDPDLIDAMDKIAAKERLSRSAWIGNKIARAVAKG